MGLINPPSLERHRYNLFNPDYRTKLIGGVCYEDATSEEAGRMHSIPTIAIISKF